jgi:hypothetical protein
MGYDFGIMRLTVPDGSFPFHPPAALEAPDLKFTDLAALAQLIVQRKGFRPNGPRGEEQHEYRWETPDGGALYVSLSDNWIGVDTHASWRYVQELYECVAELYPDAVIADPQTGDIHNAESFSAFAHEMYNRRTRNT